MASITIDFGTNPDLLAFLAGQAMAAGFPGTVAGYKAYLINRAKGEFALAEGEKVRLANQAAIQAAIDGAASKTATVS